MRNHVENDGGLPMIIGRIDDKKKKEETPRFQEKFITILIENCCGTDSLKCD